MIGLLLISRLEPRACFVYVWIDLLRAYPVYSGARTAETEHECGHPQTLALGGGHPPFRKRLFHPDDACH